jgi:hypothetical protein
MPPEPPMIDPPIKLTLRTCQVRFLMDMMMGCPLGHTEQYSAHHKVNAARLYDQLQECLPLAHRPPE